MLYEIVEMPAMSIVGKELRTNFVDGKCYSQIPAFWEKARKENFTANIKNKLHDDVIVGLYTNYSPDFGLNSGEYSLIIGTPVKNIPDAAKEFVVKEVPKAKYAVFTAKGPFDKSIGKAWMGIWQNKELKRTFTNDFEWYDKNSTNDENSVVKIYVAIK